MPWDQRKEAKWREACARASELGVARAAAVDELGEWALKALPAHMIDGSQP